jgi:7-cyano-7-deazaguanine synthase
VPGTRCGREGAGEFAAANEAGARGAEERAVVLLSGGLDSATVLALAVEAGMACHALTVLYGQRHAHEIECARALARELGAKEHRVMEVDLRSFGGSSLVGEGAVPKSGAGGTIPSTYVPARNTVFLSLALAWAEVLGAKAIYIGVNAIDYSGYPDCRPEYVVAFQNLARLATRAGVEGNAIEIRAPLLHLSKGAIVREGRRLGVDFSLTSSCYDPAPDGTPCGACDACRLRALGFAEAGVHDPKGKES